MLRRNPGFALVAVLALAIGIGANTAIFSVVDVVLLRPLPYDDPDRLVTIWETNFGSDIQKSQVSPVTYSEWVAQEQLFDEIAGWWYPQINLTDDRGDPERARTIDVTDRFFDVLGVDPVIGRRFAEGEDLQGAERVVIIGHGLWLRRFGGEPGVLGATVKLDDQPHTVIGVAPPGFDYPEQTEIWRPLGWNPKQHSRSVRFFEVVARLRPGPTVTQARADIDALGRRLETDYPDSNLGWGALVVPLHEQLVGDVRPALLVLLGAVGFVLLIACANVANLLLARAVAREKEVAVRLALGAGRIRLVSQFLTEGLVLAVISGAVGLLLAWAATRLLVITSPLDIPRLDSLGLNSNVLVFTLLVAVLTAVVFGLVPALHASRPDPAQALKDGSRESGASTGSRGVRMLLVSSEIAIALMLLVGAGLLLRSFDRLQQVDAGFRADDALTLNLQLPAATYPEWHQVAGFYDRLVDRLATVPGVESASATAFLPYQMGWPVDLYIDGRPPPEAGREPRAQVHQVTPDYFQTLGIPLLAGRGFRARDGLDAPTAVIISNAAARRYWPGQEPVGQRLVNLPDSIGPLGRLLTTRDEAEIVGVVGDVKNTGLSTAAEPAVYFHQAQFAYRSMSVVVRPQASPESLLSAVRQEIWSLDSGLPISDVRTMGQRTAAQIAQPRFSMTLLALFAAIATMLAAVGLYAVMAYSVSQRRQELGVRMALGAEPRAVMGLVVGHGMRVAVTGVVAGLVGAFFASSLLRRLLYGVSPTDIRTFAVVAVLLLGVAFLASYLPARRAARLDPVRALRGE
jgi:putative ABC transport system permease protein